MHKFHVLLFVLSNLYHRIIVLLFVLSDLYQLYYQITYFTDLIFSYQIYPNLLAYS